MVPDIKKILYATDLSENARYAFGYAVSMASHHDAKIRGESLQILKYYSLDSLFSQ